MSGKYIFLCLLIFSTSIFVWSKLSKESLFANARKVCANADVSRIEVSVSKLTRDFDSEVCVFKKENAYHGYASRNASAPHLAPHSISSVLTYSVLHAKTSSYESAEYFTSAESLGGTPAGGVNFVGATSRDIKYGSSIIKGRSCWSGADNVAISCRKNNSVYIQFSKASSR